MTIEEEIARTLEDLFDGDCGHGVGQDAAAVLMPLLNRVRAEARARVLRDFRASLITDQFTRYGIVLPDINEIVDALDEEASRIEQNSEGGER